MSANVAIVQFPGSNTERETFMACERAGLNPVEFLWNENHDVLKSFLGFIIVGGFSYEDRSRSGVIASLDPIINIIKKESEKGKPVLGICNGAQILVESGMVPGINNYSLSSSLSNNKRIVNGEVLGTGYYNEWAHLSCSIDPEDSAFTRALNAGDTMHIPFAHAEGRFVIPDNLLNILINNHQIPFRYCDNNENIINEFPTNPNGSTYNIAALTNSSGNIMAIMPHPERTVNGDKIFISMRDYIESKNKINISFLDYKLDKKNIKNYASENNGVEWVVNMIITDNEANSVQNALNQAGIYVNIQRMTHWEIIGGNNSNYAEIERSGELFNSNKEYISDFSPDKNSITFLVRQNEDMLGIQKKQSLIDRFNIEDINEIRYGVLWNIKVKSGNFDQVIKKVLGSQILFNPFSQNCYTYE
jgi:phosphoribosylformylglycinamidine synthase